MKNLGGRPVGAKTKGQDLVVDAQMILFDVDAQTQQIVEETTQQLAAIAERARRRLNEVRLDARDRAARIFRGAA